jgi:hypothetical protein
LKGSVHFFFPIETGNEIKRSIITIMATKYGAQVLHFTNMDYFLLLRDLEGSVADEINHIVSRLSVDGATHRLSGSEDLLDCSLKLLCH